MPAARYRFDSRTCSTCHSDLHNGQFTLRMAQPGPDGAARDCTACHDDISWHELPGFDHGKTDFAIEGSHRQVACDRCHRRSEPKPDVGSVLYREAPRECIGCHEDPHGRQFTGTGSTECGRCHTEQRWKPSRFDHDSGSDYKLTGAHRSAPCAGCHKAISRPGGEKVIAYRNLPQACSACHESKGPGKELRH